MPPSTSSGATDKTTQLLVEPTIIKPTATITVLTRQNGTPLLYPALFLFPLTSEVFVFFQGRILPHTPFFLNFSKLENYFS
jgi:hypothetical protein